MCPLFVTCEVNGDAVPRLRTSGNGRTYVHTHTYNHVYRYVMMAEKVKKSKVLKADTCIYATVDEGLRKIIIHTSRDSNLKYSIIVDKGLKEDKATYQDIVWYTCKSC